MKESYLTIVGQRPMMPHSFGPMNVKPETEAIRLLLSEPSKVCITTHKAPDADALGSSLALKKVLMHKGHDVVVVVPDPFPKFLQWMEGADDVLIFEWHKRKSTDALLNANVIFSLDYNRLERVGEVGLVIKDSKAKRVLIDHHLDPDKNFDVILSDTKASSTSELVFTLLHQMGMTDAIDQRVAACIYAGIMTDTGSFRFPSTSASTHRVVASLMELGLKPEIVHQAIFDTGHVGRLKLLGHILSNKFEYDEVKGVAIMNLSEAEKNEFNFAKGDTEGFVNYGLGIQGSKMSVFMSQEGGLIKFSFRSKGDLDVNVFAAQHFQGGGHKNAAGGKFEGTLEDAYQSLKNAIEKEIR